MISIQQPCSGTTTRQDIKKYIYFLHFQKQITQQNERMTSSEHLVRQQHHEEVLNLQKEIMKHEQALEQLTDRSNTQLSRWTLC